MAEQSVPVLPGQITTLAVAMPAGTTIYNGDPVNAVWISGNPTPGPGSGMRIGPKGSLSWTDAGSPVYAGPDTGVSTVTTLTLSGAVAQLVNPVDVGAAVAAQLLAKGVPSVLVGKTLVSSVITMPSDPSFPWTVPGTIGGYASLAVYVSSNKPQRLTLEWADTSQSPAAVLPGSSYILAGVTLGQAALTLGLAVRAPTLRIYFSDPSAQVSVTVYGSNRTLEEGVVLPSPFYQSQIPSRAWGAFSTVSFPDPLTSRGGPHHVRGNANLSGQKGYLVLSLLDSSGAAIDVPILDSGSGSTGSAGEALIGGTAVLPPGRYFPRWQNAGTAATFSPLLTIVPAP